MSLVQQQEAFDQLLLASLSADAATREGSENQLTELLHSQPDTIAMYFINAMRRSPHLEARQTAAVLFRRYSFHATDSNASFWPRCQPATLDAGKKELLDALSDEAPADVRHKVCDAVSHVAKNLSYASAASGAAAAAGHFWPELLQRLWACMQSPLPIHREGALRIFSAVPSVFGKELQRYINEVATVLSTSLQDHANNDVQLACCPASPLSCRSRS